ncbi:hypothetical protein MRB53_009926 [Persea americana]|uniref:Uncharacterized protein n=1 Tax=Persea americana TaxID=3435 RepID=A0ACC2LQG2_PERAE|nr:hypothetical protein MRB53_009926 [Persea americana]
MTSGRIFMSRHAAFNEDVFPFSSVGPSTPVPSSPASFTPFQWLSSVTPSSVLGPFKSPASSSIVGPAPHICPFPMTVPLPSCSTPSPTLTTTSPSTTPPVQASSQCPLHPPSPTADLSLPIAPHTTPPTSLDVLAAAPTAREIGGKAAGLQRGGGGMDVGLQEGGGGKAAGRRGGTDAGL